MGLYQGGLLMTLLFFTIMGFFLATGVLAERNPGAVQSLQCVPNSGSITQYAGLDSNTLGQSNCFTDLNSSTVTVSTLQDDFAKALSVASQLVPGDPIGQLATYVGFFIKGWVLILEIILGKGPLSIFIFLIGIPLQMLQIYFFAQIVKEIIAVFRGGAVVQ